jgi:HNH endonuclease
MDTTGLDNECALCDRSINIVGDSGEHVIPNSIGGRRQIRKFICRECNSRTGDTWDAEIWRQFSHIAMMHGVVRDRGDPPSVLIQTADGSRFLLLADGTMTIDKPNFAKSTDERGTSINISARDSKEARRMAKQVAKKNPRLSVGSLLDKMVATETHLESPVVASASFGGPLAGRSMVKSAVALAASLGVDPRHCEAARPYLKDDSETPPYAFFYMRDLIAHRPTDHAFNCVSVFGDTVSGKLVGYIEYFSLCRIAIILSESYAGEMVRGTYAFNPATGEEIDLEIDLHLSDEELDCIRENSAHSAENHKAAFDLGMAAIYRRTQLRHWERATRDAFDHACKALGLTPEETVPPERANEFVALMMEHLSPFLSRMVRR